MVFQPETSDIVLVFSMNNILCLILIGGYLQITYRFRDGFKLILL